MILFSREERRTKERQIIALFGVGLVGGAVVRALRQQGVDRIVEMPLSWRDAALRQRELHHITEAMQTIGGLPAHTQRVDVVWAAGRAGFGATMEELEPEIEALRHIAEWSRALPSRLPATSLAFHLVSSAGGLFEGQRFVDSDAAPRPLRPYGVAKLRQEHIVQSLRADFPAHIYRPSSVYGFSGIGGRSGLLSVLIENAIKHSGSRIFGSLDTVRDYVFSTDVGRFIARRVEWPVEGSQTYLLASGKPSSVSEIITMASRVVGRPLHLKLDLQPSNASHISYRASALPDDWQPIDLETGIRLVARQLSWSFESGSKR